ncbi:hypothetical protein WJX72_005136 [[Myrmecia] bisecta]|uniref:Amino acid transporter transmembrane domain-containing protein n=1 Tax=[Myrmecia] bisecta TaxID=41462 RepID=A0AAW1PE77_9CHLO
MANTESVPDQQSNFVSSVPLLRHYGTDEEGLLVLPGMQPNSPRPVAGASVLQTASNVINVFMGIGLLSMPYAMRLSGGVGLLALAATTALFCLSGKLIVHAFDRLPDSAPHTYPALGVAALGPAGRYVVAGFALSEFFGGSCILLVVMWQELVTLLPDHGVLGLTPLAFAALLAGAATIPLLLIPSFHKLSWLSMAGCISSVLVTLTVMAAVGFDPDRSRMPDQPPAGHVAFAGLSIFQSVGIFAVSVSGHSSLPVLRSSMKNRQDFDIVLNLAFGSMFIVYGLVSSCGYYYFGSAASELITTDLATNSFFTGRFLLPGVTVDRVVTACILVNAYTTYPSLVLVIQDMIVSVLPWANIHGSPRQPRRGVGQAIRLSVFAAGAAVAFMAYNVLGNAMSLVGGVCSMCTSLLLPSLFYLILHWKELPQWRRAGVVLVLAIGLALLLLIVGQNVADLNHKTHQRHNSTQPGVPSSNDLLQGLLYWPGG